jgi:hypothetical protein
MSERSRQLAERHAALRLRCAIERHTVGGEVESIVARFSAVDRVAALTRGALLHPAVIVAGVIALLAFGRSRGLRLVGRIFLLATAARRLARAAKLL